MSILIINIKELLQVRNQDIIKVSGQDMKSLPSIKNAYLLIEDDTIVDFGKMTEIGNFSSKNVIDAKGKFVLPAWCDSHTHIVFAENREQEFVDRLNGFSYEEIANRGGGILNSAKMLGKMTESELYDKSLVRLMQVMKSGTGAIEIKSGYGLSLESELKMLRVIKRIKETLPITVKATFLGAHAVPYLYRENKDAYLSLIIDQMLPKISEAQLADYIDVFCEKGYFSIEDSERIIKAGQAHGLKAKIHVNQFNAFGGVALGVKYKALSVDHLEQLNDDDIDVLKNSDTIPVALPTCSFFLGIPYTPARKLIDSGLPIALASDFNPGSSPSGNMNFVLSSACIKMKMSPEEAINAATINGAYAMGISKTHGTITKGKKANILITDPISNINILPYSFGQSYIDTVIINGNIIKKPQEST